MKCLNEFRKRQSIIKPTHWPLNVKLSPYKLSINISRFSKSTRSSEASLVLGSLNTVGFNVRVGNTSSSEVLDGFSVFVGSQKESVSA